jgi:hypothetical protein
MSERAKEQLERKRRELKRLDFAIAHHEEYAGYLVECLKIAVAPRDKERLMRAIEKTDAKLAREWARRHEVFGQIVTIEGTGRAISRKVKQ